MIGVKKKEDIFFDLFCEAFDKIMQAGECFFDLVEHYEDVEKKVSRMKALETECDIQTHKILKHLNKSFVTPFDREDIYDIAREMDNVVDVLEEIANLFLVFGIKEMKPAAQQMTRLISICVKELQVVINNLRNLHKNNVAMDQIIEVNRLENEGDLIYRQALTALFREEKDPLEIIKWKELYEFLEEALDACENVANIVEGMVMKYA